MRQPNHLRIQYREPNLPTCGQLPEQFYTTERDFEFRLGSFFQSRTFPRPAS